MFFFSVHLQLKSFFIIILGLKTQIWNVMDSRIIFGKPLFSTVITPPPPSPQNAPFLFFTGFLWDITMFDDEITFKYR